MPSGYCSECGKLLYAPDGESLRCDCRPTLESMSDLFNALAVQTAKLKRLTERRYRCHGDS